MRFVFIRHGHYTKPADKGARDRAPLTDRGRAAARAAGEFLAVNGVRPDLVIRTDRERTRETAACVLEVLGAACPVRVEAGGFAAGADAAAIRARLAQWIAAAGAGRVDTLFFVGHGIQQAALLRRFGGPDVPSAHHACVLVYDLEADGTCRVGACSIGS
jgi:broad specificity phosphatase PhoE